MRFFSVFLASLLAAISFHAIPARADWRLEAVGLYSELMELARTGALRDRGFAAGSPGADWMNRAKALDKTSPRGAAAFIPTPFGDVVVVGELLQLAREISSGYRLSGSKAAYAANMSMQWAGVSLCLKMPNSCKLP
tara:strand:- start:15613 stop:16023 length:411 start_codon:yes stop_codon:yes gene_type:complete